ncbi:sulfate transporter CysZ [Thalassotalea sp. G20_0]|uniref:sulfate transporter CysZ n=1 Tax=Thalassotalea sp. G20_0 TaxID=2821093 RepID=UPI001ADCC614|nr:sulfate transporter CysZ [Thalassotalea sp. G20_0]MBO9496379.1 sulfate transporter CysZ [Thalassotalea sp. G20_0]
MIHNTPASGPGYFIRGLKMILLPQLRWFVLIPLVINILVFAGIIYWASGHFSVWMEQLTGWMPEWLAFLEYLLWPLFFLALAAVMFFTFTIIGNFIAAPFNALLAEKVQQMEGAELPDLKLSDWLTIVPRSIGRELRKLLYFLPRAIVLLILSFVPVLGFVLWFLFNGWMMAIQYCDYAADNRGVSFSDMLSRLKPKLSTSWPFGAVVNLAMLIPLINLLIIPAAVVGATLLWEREIEQPVAAG